MASHSVAEDNRSIGPLGAAPNRVLMLSSTDGTHGRRSGYGLLAEYVEGARLIETSRPPRPSLIERAGSKLLSQFSLSRWYRLGSGELEFKSLIRMICGYRGPLHVLWGERDLGYLDIISRVLHRKLVCTFHTCPDSLPLILRRTGRLRNVSTVVLMSASQRRFFTDSGMPSSNIHVVLHGVDTSYFKPAPGSQNETFTVLFVGSYRRDFDRLARICGRLQDCPQLAVRVVAPATVHDRIPGFSNITFLRPLTDDQLREEYQHAHCLLMPVESATANNAILEALACGLPVVADAIDGIPEYAGKGTGLLVPSREVEEFVKAILAIKSSPRAQEEMSLAARKRAEQLDWSAVAKTMTEIYAA